MAICDSRKGCQVDEFLFNLAPNMQKDGKKIRLLFSLVAMQGPQYLSTEISHNIADDIFQFTQGRIRITWFYDKGKMIVCCYSFVKKGQKTPKDIIDQSIECMREYRLAKARNAVEELKGV